jgi:hypothetical protein
MQKHFAELMGLVGILGILVFTITSRGGGEGLCWTNKASTNQCDGHVTEHSCGANPETICGDDFAVTKEDYPEVEFAYEGYSDHGNQEKNCKTYQKCKDWGGGNCLPDPDAPVNYGSPQILDVLQGEDGCIVPS